MLWRAGALVGTVVSRHICSTGKYLLSYTSDHYAPHLNGQLYALANLSKIVRSTLYTEQEAGCFSYSTCTQKQVPTVDSLCYMSYPILPYEIMCFEVLTRINSSPYFRLMCSFTLPTAIICVLLMVMIDWQDFETVLCVGL